jgi:hypothetical protein
MNRQTKASLAVTASIAALTLLGLIGGWLILLGDGFHHQLTRFSPEAVFVSGAPALVMAAICFLLAATGVASLVQNGQGSRVWYASGLAAVLLPPLLFALVH